MRQFSKKCIRPIKKKTKSIRRWIQWRLLFLFIRVTRVLAVSLPESLAYRMGEILGDIWRVLSRRNKARALKSLETAFPEWDIQQRRLVTRAVFKNLGRCGIEILRFYGKKYDLDRNVSVDNIERLRAAMEKGKGVVVVSAHIGNWELLAGAAAAYGFPMKVVADRIRDPRIDDILYKSRAGAGVSTMFRDEPIVPMLRNLRKNEILAILIDQDSHFDGVFVKHFNQPTYTARGPAILSIASGAPILPVFIARNNDGRHRIYIEEPITADPTKDREKEILRITQCCLDAVEKYIRRFPEQWVWMHRRWKTKPEDVSNSRPRRGKADSH